MLPKFTKINDNFYVNTLLDIDDTDFTVRYDDMRYKYMRYKYVKLLCEKTFDTAFEGISNSLITFNNINILKGDKLGSMIYNSYIKNYDKSSMTRMPCGTLLNINNLTYFQINPVGDSDIIFETTMHYIFRMSKQYYDEIVKPSINFDNFIMIPTSNDNEHKYNAAVFINRYNPPALIIFSGNKFNSIIVSTDFNEITNFHLSLTKSVYRTFIVNHPRILSYYEIVRNANTLALIRPEYILAIKADEQNETYQLYMPCRRYVVKNCLFVKPLLNL